MTWPQVFALLIPALATAFAAWVAAHYGAKRAVEKEVALVRKDVAESKDDLELKVEGVHGIINSRFTEFQAIVEKSADEKIKKIMADVAVQVQQAFQEGKDAERAREEKRIERRDSP